MTEFAPVLPAKLYPLIDVHAPGAWHFVHAPQVVGPSGDRLVDWLKRFHCTVVLDCFAFELGGELPRLQDVYEAAAILRGTGVELIIICPDILKDGKESFALLRHNGPALTGYGRLMVVPHGESIHEWMGWADRSIDFCRSMGIRLPIIGLPRYMSAWGRQTRYNAATWVYHYYHGMTHLLGAGLDLGEVKMAASAPGAWSCDSTLPFTYAMTYGLYGSRQVSNKVEMELEWWDLGISDIGGDALMYAQLNVAIWKEALRSAAFAEPYSIG